MKKNNSNSNSNSKQSGFTLVEVMISLLIFATGMLGVAFQMSLGLKNTINTEVHSSVMQVALQSIEPLKRSVLQGNEAFKTELTNLNTNGRTPPFASNSNQANFSIAVERAVDENNNGLLDTAVTNWSPPYTVVLNISFDTGVPDTDDDNIMLHFFTTHVLAP